MKLLDQHGNLKGWVGVAVGVLGAVVLFAPLYWELHIYLVIAGFIRQESKQASGNTGVDHQRSR